MTERCHLSGLPIDEGSAVLLLPVKFGAVTESSLCYQSDRLVRAFAMPVSGILSDGYGGVTTSGMAMELLRLHVEKNLADNSPACQLGAEPVPYRLAPSNRYAAIRRGNFDEAHPGEFCSEIELLALHNDPNNATTRYPLKTLTAEQLLSLFRRASLSQLSGGHIFRLTYIMIDKTFFDNLVSAHYQAEWDAVKNGLMALALNAPEYQKRDDMENLSDWLLFCLENDAMKVMDFDSDDQPREAMSPTLRKMTAAYHAAKGTRDEANALSALTEWVDVMTCYAILQRVYRHLGKTYYPQVSRANTERQNQFTAFLYAQQEKRRQTKREEYSPGNGYDEDTQNRYQWR